MVFACLSGTLYPAPDTVAEARQLLQVGKPHEAEILLRALARQHPKDGSVRQVLGVALALQGELPAAVAEYNAALALEPHEPQSTLR